MADKFMQQLDAIKQRLTALDVGRVGWRVAAIALTIAASKKVVDANDKLTHNSCESSELLNSPNPTQRS